MKVVEPGFELRLSGSRDMALEGPKDGELRSSSTGLPGEHQVVFVFFSSFPVSYSAPRLTPTPFPHSQELHLGRLTYFSHRQGHFFEEKAALTGWKFEDMLPWKLGFGSSYTCCACILLISLLFGVV